MANDDQVAYWDGEGGAHWVAEADRYTVMTRRFGERVLEAARLGPGARVLDVGCGTGPLSRAAAHQVGPDGFVLGIDISGPMLALARDTAAAEGLEHVSFEQADAQAHAFDPESFDAVVSRFGVMFFEDPEAAFANLARALKPGGRLGFVCWKGLIENQWIMVPVGAALQFVPMPEMGEPGAPGPFALADPERIEGILRAAGFEAWDLEDIEEPVRLGTTVDDVLPFIRNSDMGRTLLEGAAPEVVEQGLQAVAEALAPYERDDGVVLPGRAWLVSATKV